MIQSLSPVPQVDIAWQDDALLGEGAMWHPVEKRLYWVDIEGCCVNSLDPLTGEGRSIQLDSRIGAVFPCRDGGIVMALQTGLVKLDTISKQQQLLVSPLKDPSIRFNDGKCDAKGRCWIGTMHLEQEKDAAVLMRVDHDLKVEIVLDKVTISNGLIWSLDNRTMYYIDTPKACVYAFDFDLIAGTITNKRTIIEIPEAMGHPDGMTIDIEGRLWIAMYGGAAVTRWDPDTGVMLEQITIDAPNITSCAFGGADFSTLYITSARQELSDEELAQYPQSGSLFSVRPGVKGMAANFWGE